MGIIQTINVASTLRAMGVGSTLDFPACVNENTLRHACVRLKATKVGIWSVDKLGTKGYKVTRTA